MFQFQFNLILQFVFPKYNNLQQNLREYNGTTDLHKNTRIKMYAALNYIFPNRIRSKRRHKERILLPGMIQCLKGSC